MSGKSSGKRIWIDNPTISRAILRHNDLRSSPTCNSVLNQRPVASRVASLAGFPRTRPAPFAIWYRGYARGPRPRITCPALHRTRSPAHPLIFDFRPSGSPLGDQTWPESACGMLTLESCRTEYRKEKPRYPTGITGFFGCWGAHPHVPNFVEMAEAPAEPIGRMPTVGPSLDFRRGNRCPLWVRTSRAGNPTAMSVDSLKPPKRMGIIYDSAHMPYSGRCFQVTSTT